MIFIMFNLQDIDKLGKAGETVKVAPGYFRNHLMPKLLAVPNIDKFAYLVTEQRKVFFCSLMSVLFLVLIYTISWSMSVM